MELVELVLFTNLFAGRTQIGFNSPTNAAKILPKLQAIRKITPVAPADAETVDIALAIIRKSLDYLSLRLKRDGRQKSSLDAGRL